MTDIVNLRRARKAKARAEAAVKATGNRTTFGRAKSERKRTDAERALEARRLDAHQRRPADGLGADVSPVSLPTQPETKGDR